MKSRTKYRLSTLLLVLLLLFLTFGYAFLTQSLNINGLSSINNATWNVYLDNVQVVDGSVTAETPVIDTNKTTVSYSVHLAKPGDFYEFTVDAKNTGSIDSMIESIVSTINGNPISELPNYLEYSVSYDDDETVKQYHLLKTGETAVIKVRVGYKNNINSEDLPTENQTLIMNVSMSFVQSNENGKERPYLIYNSFYPSVPANAPVSDIPNKKTSPSQISNNTFIRFKIVDGYVTKRWIGFKVNDNYYYLSPGGATYNNETGSYNDDSIYYEANKEIIINVFGIENCNVDTFSDGHIRTTCSGINNFSVNLEKDGQIRIGYGYWACKIWQDETSRCDDRL